MAVVYRAQDIMLERPVAIKLLRQDYSNNQSFREQFRREARSAANLSHPNIVTVHDFGFDAGRLFIVMEFIDGEDLKTVIRNKGGIFTLQEAIPLITQACAAIGYAHRAGIIHCDVKPHNMLVTKDQRLKMTDFGIARALSTIDPNEKNEEVWGSPQYFSPEQASGKAPSPASDVYSLGVVLYEMLCGQLPFTATDAEELARNHRETKPIPPRHLNNQIPAQLEQIMLKALSKEAMDRFRNADMFGKLLEAFGPPVSTYHIATTPADATPTQVNQAQPPSGEKTQPFKTGQSRRKAGTAPAQQPVVPTAPTQRPPTAAPVNKNKLTLASFMSLDIILLGILALILGIGLIPFSLFVFMQFLTP